MYLKIFLLVSLLSFTAHAQSLPCSEYTKLIIDAEWASDMRSPLTTEDQKKCLNDVRNNINKSNIRFCTGGTDLKTFKSGNSYSILIDRQPLKARKTINVHKSNVDEFLDHELLFDSLGILINDFEIKFSEKPNDCTPESFEVHYFEPTVNGGDKYEPKSKKFTSESCSSLRTTWQACQDIMKKGELVFAQKKTVSSRGVKRYENNFEACIKNIHGADDFARRYFCDHISTLATRTRLESTADSEIILKDKVQKPRAEK